MAHPDVPAEQAHVDSAYRRLEQMRSTAVTRLAEALGERGGTFQSYTERDIRVRHTLSRIEQLEIGSEPLVFGRIDRNVEESGDSADGDASEGSSPDSLPPPPASLPGTEAFHIGRVAVSDADQEPLVVDWRAPVAEPFYRATGAHPMGLRRRRHFLAEGRRVLDLGDELFGPDGAADELGLAGSEVLLAALERSRTGRMRDIVATVQAEQDEVIRSPLAGVLVVQGGPGTGKTAVALHRAAYLLYTHRFPLERQGVLVVGPNPTFLRYISQVLPSLGEIGVELSTVSDLYGRRSRQGGEGVELARLKGEARMARVIARAVGDRERPLRRTAVVGYARWTLRLTPEDSARLLATVKRRGGTHNGRRRMLENLIWRHFLQSMDPAPEMTAEELGRELRRVPEASEILERMWPLLTPEALLHDLLGAPALLALAGRGVLDSAEQALLGRAREESPFEVAWTDADVALLDEARALLGPLRRPKPDDPPDVRPFGHVVIDEAQDLSPMQLRMLGRRTLSASMTVVGDLAQAVGTWAPESWSEVVANLPGRRGWRLATLTVSYRTPSEIMDLANEVLAEAVPGAAPPKAVRSAGYLPRFVYVDPVVPSEGARRGGVVAAVAQTAASCLADVVRPDGSGRVGAIAPPTLLDEIGEAFTSAGLAFNRAGGVDPEAPLSLLSPREACGLEFDAVVVVEPSRMVREAPQGLRALYVALTRTTRQLLVVHSEELPDALASAPTPSSSPAA